MEPKKRDEDPEVIGYGEGSNLGACVVFLALLGRTQIGNGLGRCGASLLLMRATCSDPWGAEGQVEPDWIISKTDGS